MKNMWDIVLDNYLDIYLFEDWIKKSDDEEEIEDFIEFKNRKINEKEIIKKKLENIEEKLRIILNSKDLKKIKEIKNKLMFMIAYASKYLTSDIFTNTNFLKKDFSNINLKNDFFGKIAKNENEVYDQFINESLDTKIFNKEFLISKFHVESNVFYINNENLDLFFQYIFKNIYWLRSTLKNESLNENVTIVTALITLLIINGYFSNFIFNKISIEYKNHFKLVEDELKIINDIKNKFISKSRNYKNKYNINVFSNYDQEKFSNIIILFEKQFNLSEYNDLLKNKKERYFELTQLKNRYVKFFYNWSNLFFQIERYLIEESKIFEKENNKIEFNKKWNINKNDEKYNNLSEQIELLEIILKGNKHNGIYVEDDGKNIKDAQWNLLWKYCKAKEKYLNFLNIYEITINLLIELKNNFKKIQVNDWIFIDENFIYNKKKEGNEKLNKDIFELKSMHKGFVISNINRLIKNLNKFLINQANKKVTFKLTKEESKIQKTLIIFSSGNINENLNNREDRFNKIKEKINFNKNLLEKVNYFEKKISNLKKENEKNIFLQNLVNKINLNSNDLSFTFKFKNDEDTKLQFIKIKAINNIFKTKEELFNFIVNDKTKTINKEELFLYYKNVLNKKNLNEDNFTKNDLDDLINKNTIKTNTKYIIYDNNTITKATYDEKNKNNTSIVDSFFNTVIKEKLLKYETFNEYRENLINNYEKLGLKLYEENPNLKIFYLLEIKIKNTNQKKEIIIDQLENSYKKLLNKMQKDGKNEKNIIFFTYIKKYLINLTSEKLFKKSFLEIYNSSGKILKSKMLNIFPMVKETLIPFNENGRDIFKIDSKKLNYQRKVTRNFNPFKKAIENENKNSEDKKIFLNSFGELKDFSISYKIKSDILILNKYNEAQKIIDTPNKSCWLKIESKKIYELQNLLKDNEIINKYFLIYNELNNYKISKKREIIIKNIEIKPKIYKSLISYNVVKIIYRKIDDEDEKQTLFNENILNNNENYISINSPISFNELKKIAIDKLKIAKIKRKKKTKNSFWEKTESNKFKNI